MASLVEEENSKTCELTDWELEVVTKVFRSFETGLREGSILPMLMNYMSLDSLFYLWEILLVIFISFPPEQNECLSASFWPTGC